MCSGNAVPIDSIVAMEKFHVRLLEPDDAAALAAYYLRNREPHREWSPVPPEGFFTEAFHRIRYDFYREANNRGAEFRFLIVTSDDISTVVGIVTLTAIERGVFQNGRFGYSVDAEWQGRGIMTAAIREVINFAFDELGLHRVEANVMPRNIPSRRVLEKCGFTCVGRSPRMVKINGEWEDHEIYMLLNE